MHRHVRCRVAVRRAVVNVAHIDDFRARPVDQLDRLQSKRAAQQAQMPRRSSLLQPPEPHHLAGPRTLGSTVLGGSKATGRKRPIWCRLNNGRRLCCQILCTRIVDTVVLVVESKPEAAQVSNLDREARRALWLLSC